MRLTISRKIFFIFALLTFFSLALGGGVVVALKTLASLRVDIDTVNEFRVQLASLQATQREVILEKKLLENDRIRDKFEQFQQLAREIDHLLSDRNFKGWAPLGSVSKQFDYYKQAYLEVFNLYRRDMGFLETNNQIINSISQRAGFLPPQQHAEVQALLTEMLIIQTTIYQNRLGADINRMKGLAERIKESVADEQFDEAVNSMLLNVEKNYVNHLAIVNREDFLKNTAENFELISLRSLEAIGDDIVASQQRLMVYILIFLILMPIVTAALWRMSAGYFSRFLDSLRFAVSSIRAGKFDFAVPAVANDELGDQVFFVKELAENIKDKIDKIAESEEKFRGLVENISDWSWSIDENYYCTYSSPQCEKIIGLKSLALIDQSVDVFFGDSNILGFSDAFVDFIKKQESFDELLHLVKKKDGETLTIETSGRTILDDAGQFKGYRFLSRDMSILRKSEDKLRKRSLDQRLLNDIMGLVLTEMDLDDIFGRFLELVLAASWLELEETGAIFLVNEDNNALVLRASRGRKEGIEKSCSQVPFGVCLCGQAAQSGKIIFADHVDDRHEIILEGMHRHGHLCLPIHSVAGEIKGVLCCYLKENSSRNAHAESTLTIAATILGSIIKRRQAEDALYDLNLQLENQVEQRTAQLTAANKELDSFAYSVSHDLRAPLRAVDGFSLALSEDCSEQLGEEGKSYLERIRKACQRMGQQIDDILQLSRLTRGEINREKIDLSSLAEDVLEVLQEGQPDRVVETIVEPGLEVEADPVMVRAVMENLLGNAWKYTVKEACAKIEVSAKKESGRTVFMVKDNGAGFDMKYVDKLFIAFQRLHSPAEFEGSGIGLATVQRIVHRHGGKIWAESKEGNGSCFYFYL